MVTIKDGCGCDPCDCDWKQKLKEAYARASVSVNKVGDETGRVYYPDGTGFVKIPLLTKEQIDSIAEIDNIKTSVDELNVTVPALETQVTGVTESLVSDVKVLNGTTAGKFKVRIEREKASLIDSNEYDLSKVNSIELIQGSGPAMVKAQLTLSDGTVLRSDDFLFTSESIGSDVYISSFTFKNGNVDGTISADIGLNNGTTLEANNFVVPTDPSVVTTITDLQNRMTAVESADVGELATLKTTVGEHTVAITKLDNDVADIMLNKADVTNTEQIITNKRVDTEIVRYKYNATDAYGIQGTGKESDPFLITGKKTVAGQEVYVPIGKIGVLDSDGNPTNFTSGGGTIINLSSFDGLKNGDIILITSLSTEGSSLVLSQFFGMYTDGTIYGWGAGKSVNTKVYISKILLRSPTDIAIYYYNDGSNSTNFSNTTVKTVSGLKVTF